MNELLARAQAKKQKLSKTELQDASDKVKANLVLTLQKIVNMLAREPADSINLAQFSRLVDTASKLFSWPAAKAIEVTDINDSPAKLHAAINLALIRTTPEQLRAKARQITLNVTPQETELAS